MKTEKEAHDNLQDIADIYAVILAKYTQQYVVASSPPNMQQERLFFETLYDFSTRVLFTMNERKRWHAIENEIGRIFRSDHFNISVRKNEQQDKPFLTSREAEKRRSANPSPFAASKSEWKPKVSVHTAISKRSPVIASKFPTAKDAMKAKQQETPSPDASPTAVRSLGVVPPAGASRVQRSAARSPTRKRSSRGGGELPAESRIEEAVSIDGEEAMDAEIARASDAFNELVGCTSLDSGRSRSPDTVRA